MRYRVHYIIGQQRRVAEVEAPSPEQAKLKFRNIQWEPDARRHTPAVLSITSEPVDEPAAW